MKNEKLVEAIGMLIEASKKQAEALESLSSALSGSARDGSDITPSHSEDASSDSVQPEAAVPSVNEDGSVTMEGRFNREELMEMKFNELKKLASSLEISASGTRSEIVERLLSVKSSVTVEKGMEEPVESVSGKVAKKSPLQKKDEKKPLRKKQEPEIPSKWMDMAKGAVEDMEADDIIAALEEAEVSVPDGVGEDELVLIVAKAFMDGKLEPDEDDSPEVDEVSDTISGDSDTRKESGSDEMEVDENTYFPDFDPDGLNDPKSGMPKVRLDAIRKWQGDFLEKYDSGKITLEDITKNITVSCTQDELDSLGDDPKEDDIVCLYMETMKRHIDNDGVMHEGGDPYEVGADNLCCGHILTEVDGEYVCEVCGSRYEG